MFRYEIKPKILLYFKSRIFSRPQHTLQVEQSAWRSPPVLHVGLSAPNIHRFYNFFFTGILSNERFLIWLLTYWNLHHILNM